MRRRPCLTYACVISLAQIGWVLQILLGLTAGAAITLGGILVLMELSAPVFVERRDGGTPWHAHHIAERHSLFAIIALGEGVVGTVAALSAVVQEQGWTLDTALIGVAGTGLTFGMWWVYSLLPSAQVLHRYRHRALAWGLVQLLIVSSIVATGAGLHVAAYFIEGHAYGRPLPAVLSAVLPVAGFLGSIYVLSWYLVRRFDRFHLWLLLATAIVMAVTVIASVSGVNIAICLLMIAIAPWMTVVACELRGYVYESEAVPTSMP